MIEFGALRSQATGYNLEFKSKFAQKSPLVSKGGRNGPLPKNMSGVSMMM